MIGINGSKIRLRSGRYFDLAEPQPDQFTLKDIAGALSKICRFGGQCEKFYSVAEHSFNCAYIAARDRRSEEAQKACLMHDAAEAFVGDCVRPLKMLLTDFKTIENGIAAVIAQKFQIDFETHRAVVTEIDNAMLFHEKRYLFPHCKELWTGEASTRKFKLLLDYETPAVAEHRFLNFCTDYGLVDES